MYVWKFGYLLYFCRMKTTRNKIEREKRIVELMIRLYCRKIEHHEELCESCRELLAYAHKRLDSCRYGVQKKACRHCPTHCYRKDMRLKVREVMRVMGPRMLWYAPVEALRHLWQTIRG